MARDADDLVARGMGVEREIVPLLSFVFADFQALGGWPDIVVALLGEVQLSPGAVVVDLGCGKGAAAVGIARRIGCRVVGVDLFEPFLEDAVRAAREAGVADLCAFRAGDLMDTIRNGQVFDAAVFAAVGAGLFGGYAGCVGALRQCVRPGGAIVISDGVLESSRGARTVHPGYEYYEPHAEALKQITAHGDRLLQEILVPDDEVAQQGREDLETLRQRVDQLLRAHPEHRATLEAFSAAQEAEFTFLTEETREAVWLLRRT